MSRLRLSLRHIARRWISLFMLSPFSYPKISKTATPRQAKRCKQNQRLSCISPSVGIPLQNTSTVHTTSSFLTLALVPCSSSGSPGCESPCGNLFFFFFFPAQERAVAGLKNSRAQKLEGFSLPRQQGRNGLKGASGTSPPTFEAKMNHGPLLCKEGWEGTQRIRLIFLRFPVCLSAFSRVTAVLHLPCINRSNILDYSPLLYDFNGVA